MPGEENPFEHHSYRQGFIGLFPKLRKSGTLRYTLKRNIVRTYGDTMIRLHEQYLVDDQGHRTAAVVPIAEWEQILESLEELDDIRAYDEAKSSPSDPIPFEQAVSEITRRDAGLIYQLSIQNAGSRRQRVWRVKTMTVRDIAIRTIQQLPEDASWEDVQERINFVAGVRKGLRELDRGKGISHEKVKEEFAEWLSS